MVKAWAWSSGFPCQLVLACSVVLGLAQGGGHAQPPVSELAPCPQEDAHTRCLIQKRPQGGTAREHHEPERVALVELWSL